MTTSEPTALTELQQATAALQRANWRLKGVTRTLGDCVTLAESNRDGLREVLDELERLYPPERPTLHVVTGDEC
jgi:hypothetical protein